MYVLFVDLRTVGGTSINIHFKKPQFSVFFKLDIYPSSYILFTA